MAKAIVIVEDGVVKSVVVDGEDVQVLVLDRDDPCGGDYLRVAGDKAALDTMAQALSEVDAAQVKDAFEAVERGLAGNSSFAARLVANAIGLPAAQAKQSASPK